MRRSSLSLNQEIPSPLNNNNQASTLSSQKIIAKQQQVIASLLQQMMLLKEYIALGDISGVQTHEQTKKPIADPNSISNQSKTPSHSIHAQQSGNSQLIHSIASILELPADSSAENIIESVRKLKEIAQKKSEPVFVERIKVEKVPITVEKIVEKIVYVDKSREQMDKTIHKQKPKAEEERSKETKSNRTLNQTYSQKDLRNTKPHYERDRQRQRERQRQRDRDRDRDREQERDRNGYKYYQKQSRPQQFLKQGYDVTGNFVKKRNSGNRDQYYRKY